EGLRPDVRPGARGRLVRRGRLQRRRLPRNRAALKPDRPYRPGRGRRRPVWARHAKPAGPDRSFRLGAREMPTPTKGPRLGGSPAHERLMLANLAPSPFKHGKIQTPETKAKRLRPLAERLVTFAKRGDLHSRRRVLTVVRDKDVVYELFST